MALVKYRIGHHICRVCVAMGSLGYKVCCSRGRGTVGACWRGRELVALSLCLLSASDVTARPMRRDGRQILPVTRLLLQWRQTDWAADSVRVVAVCSARLKLSNLFSAYARTPCWLHHC
jgi:hypothetical protein